MAGRSHERRFFRRRQRRVPTGTGVMLNRRMQSVRCVRRCGVLSAVSTSVKTRSEKYPDFYPGCGRKRPFWTESPEQFSVGKWYRRGVVLGYGILVPTAARCAPGGEPLPCRVSIASSQAFGSGQQGFRRTKKSRHCLPNVTCLYPLPIGSRLLPSRRAGTRCGQHRGISPLPPTREPTRVHRSGERSNPRSQSPS